MARDYVCSLCTTRYSYIPPDGCHCTSSKTTIYHDGKESEIERERKAGAKQNRVPENKGCSILLMIMILLLSLNLLRSQVVNSNKITVAQFYNAQVKTVELNGGKIQAQFKLGFLSWSNNYRYRNQLEETRSAQKHNTFFLNLGITNSSSFLNLNKFDFKENNGYIIGATYQHSFSEIYLAADSINYNPHRLQTWTISLNYQKDKFKNFNPDTDQISIARPEQLILKGGYSLYRFKYRETAKFKFSWIPSINGQVNFIDYNSTKLQNYLLNDLGTEDGEVTFTNSTSFSGKYGVINNNISSANLSISSAIVPENSFWKLPIFSPIPYAGVSFFEVDKPRWNAGIALGFLSGSLLDSERKEKAGGIYRKFNVPSFLTIGVDWNYQGGIGSKPNYFITGSIKLN